MITLLYTLCITVSSCAFFYANAEPAINEDSNRIHLIWQINKDIFCETDWIKEVLADVDYTDISDGKYSVIKDRSIIIIPREDEAGQREYFRKMASLGYSFAVIQVGDENYTAPTDFYPAAKFILRSYWHKKFLEQKNVFFFPLGYKQGFWNGFAGEEKKDASQRKYVWSFAGQITGKPTREAMINRMKTIPSGFVHEIFAWADPNSLSGSSYRDVLRNTIFVPCPTGWWNLDSFRVYEALESGAIPIVENKPIDYFSSYFPGHPFITISDWSEAPTVIKDLLANPCELEKRRIKCDEWWKNYKKELSVHVSTLIKNAFPSGIHDKKEKPGLFFEENILSSSPIVDFT